MTVTVDWVMTGKTWLTVQVAKNEEQWNFQVPRSVFELDKVTIQKGNDIRRQDTVFVHHTEDSIPDVASFTIGKNGYMKLITDYGSIIGLTSGGTGIISLKRDDGMPGVYMNAGISAHTSTIIKTMFDQILNFHSKLDLTHY